MIFFYLFSYAFHFTIYQSVFFSNLKTFHYISESFFVIITRRMECQKKKGANLIEIQK